MGKMRSSWRLPLLGALVAGALLKFPAWVGQPSLLPLPAHTQRSQRLQGAQRPQRTQRHSWTAGPLGPVESAAAFRIYYLPFVEPLDIDGNLLDQLFGGWFGPVAPLILGVVVFWVQGQINAIRREQEGKVLSGAAKARTRRQKARRLVFCFWYVFFPFHSESAVSSRPPARRPRVPRRGRPCQSPRSWRRCPASNG